MKVAIIVVGVTLVVLLSKIMANHLKKTQQISDRDAQLRSLKVMFFSLAGVTALGVMISAVLPSLKLAMQADRYKRHAQIVDINDYLSDDLKTTPAVWKVTDKDFSNSVYLMGSIHILTDKTLPFPDYITDIYSKCLTLAVEKIPSDSTDTDFGVYKLSDNSKIFDQISKNTYRVAKDFLKERGLYFDSFDDYNVEFWYSIVYEAVISSIKNIDYANGVDQHFIKLAQKDRKHLIGIDSSIENGLPTPSLKLTEFMICDLIENSDQTAKELSEVYANWANGDIDKLIDDLSEIPEDLIDDYKIYQKALTTDRNAVMVDGIEKLIKNGDEAFVIVGAAHFAGDKGIIALLKQHGYSIERIG